jgi:25S rRNA (cytosine2278-C5)-methyltransferase
MKIHAFERDRHRFGTLQRMLAKAGCKNVKAVNADFLQADPQDTKYRNVTHMYVEVTIRPLLQSC